VAFSKRGGKKTVLAKNQEPLTLGLVLDADSVYFATDQGLVLRARRDGKGTVARLVRAEPLINDLEGDADALYFANGTLWRWTQAAGRAERLAAVPATLLALDDRSVYTTISGSDAVLYKVPKAGGTPVPLARGLEFPAAIAVSESAVFVATKRYIVRIPKELPEGAPPLDVK
jgi:hypothetical protein